MLVLALCLVCVCLYRRLSQHFPSCFVYTALSAINCPEKFKVIDEMQHAEDEIHITVIDLMEDTELVDNV